jgi:hypothetical protein
MFLNAINHKSPIDRYRVLENKLDAMDRDISKFKKQPVSTLREAISVLEERISSKRFESGFMDFMKDETYVKDIYTRDALACLVEFKTSRDASVTLVPGMHYYNATIVEGKVTGRRCYYLSEDKAFWSDINEDERVLKALQIMEWGSDDNFRKIYFELADGRLFESTEALMIEHITESSDEALDDIETYCNSLWEGKWPWEISAPAKLRETIKENTQMTKRSVQEFREDFSETIRRLNEGEIERSAVITKMQGFVEDIDNMLEKLARTSGNLLTDVRERVRAEFGEDATDHIDQLVSNNIRGAADILSDLKVEFAKYLDEMISGSKNEAPDFDQPDDGMGNDMEMGAGDDEFGEPEEIEGEPDLGDEDLGDDLDFENDDEDGERDKK